MESTSNWRLRTAVICYILCVLFALTFSAIYLFRSEFMPYHAAVVGQSWSEAAPGYQVLIVGLMKVCGGAWLSISIAVSILLIGPFRQGMRWAYWAIPATALPAMVVNLYITAKVALTTPGNPPWHLNALGLIILIVGFVLSMTAEQKAILKETE